MSSAGKRAAPARAGRELVEKPASDTPKPPEDITIPTKTNETRLCVVTTILGKPFVALVDTGASESYIGSEVWKHLEANRFRMDRGKQRRVKLADGQEAVTEGEVTFPLRVRGAGASPQVRTAEFRVSWSVFPTLSVDAVIGMDFLTEYRVKIDAGRRVVQISPGASRGRQPGTSPKISSIQGLTEHQKVELDAFLQQALSSTVQGRKTENLVEHNIKLKPGTEPIKQKYYTRNPAMQAIINREVDSMMTRGVIEPSSSSWSSPVVLVKKKNGKYRFCIDFRKVNSMSKPDAYPLRRSRGCWINYERPGFSVPST